MHDKNEPPPTLTFPLRAKRMQVTSEGQELHPSSPFPMMKNTIIGVDTKARCAEVREMTL